MDNHSALPLGPYISPQSFIPYPSLEQQQQHYPGTAIAPHIHGAYPPTLPHQPVQATAVTEETEDTDSDGGGPRNPANPSYKCKPRRKATQKPVGSDQKRQAFSKRKRGIVLKAYQLYKLTDAKVFMFMVNDKGSSWAYASPSFGSSLRPEHLKHMRELADLPHTPKHVTEVMAHPKLDDTDRYTDNRHLYLTSVSVQDNLHLVSGSVPASLPYLPPPLPPQRMSSGPFNDSMLPHVGQMHHPNAMLPHSHLPEQYLGHPQQHLPPHHQMQPTHMQMQLHHNPHHQMYQLQALPPQQLPAPLQQLQQQQQQQQQQTHGLSASAQMQIVPLGAASAAPLTNATAPEDSTHSTEKPALEDQPHQEGPTTGSSISQKPGQDGTCSPPPKVGDAADSTGAPPQQAIASSGKDGSDDAIMITAASADLGSLKPETEAEGVQSKPAGTPDHAQQGLLTQQQQQQQQQQPTQQQQQQQRPQQHLQQQLSPSLCTGRVIADPSGNLYRVVHDQLLPLLPHELEQHSVGMLGGGSGSSQSPGLATLAAAAAAAVRGAPGGMQGSRGDGSAAATQPPPLHHQHAHLGGGMYGAPTSYPGQPQYLMLPQHVGMGYNGLNFQGVSQPLYVDGVGGAAQGLAGGMGSSSNFMGSQPMLSMPMTFPMGNQHSSAGLQMGSYTLVPQHMAGSGFSMPSQPTPQQQQPSSSSMQPMSAMAAPVRSVPAP